MPNGTAQRRARQTWVRLGAALVLSAGLTLPAAAQDASQDEIDIGHDIYGEMCARCHGENMVNAGTVTFDLRRFPKDDFARFRNSVLNGKGKGMPPWRDKISDDDLKSLWAYVRSGG